MKLITTSQTNTFKNSETCTAIEYPINDPDINVAVVLIRGRYPDTGRTANLECKEVVYVIKGNGKLICEGTEVLLHQGDVVFIDKGERYYWEGDMDLFVPCTPAWFPEQHAMVD